MLILLCFDTSKSKLTRKNGRDIYLRGLTDFENALRVVDTVTTINNIEWSFDEGLKTFKFDANWVNADKNRHTCWNRPNKMPGQYLCWVLFSGSAGQKNTLHHCNRKHVIYLILCIYVRHPSLIQTPSVINRSHQMICVLTFPTFNFNFCSITWLDFGTGISNWGESCFQLKFLLEKQLSSLCLQLNKLHVWYHYQTQSPIQMATADIPTSLESMNNPTSHTPANWMLTTDHQEHQRLGPRCKYLWVHWHPRWQTVYPALFNRYIWCKHCAETFVIWHQQV